MISLKLIIYLSIGTIAMLIPVVFQSLWYKIKLWKSIIATILLTITGTIGTYLMFFIENHWIGGTSFFGAVFFVPIPFILYAILLKIKYKELVDICAPAECIMLVIMKIQCLISGCCEGMVISVNSNNSTIRFPSQIVEMINAFVLCIVLLLLSYKKKFRGYIYPMYLILYGMSRFVLNCFREDFYTTDMFIPYGNLWSIISVVIGVTWFICKKQGIFNFNKK